MEFAQAAAQGREILFEGCWRFRDLGGYRSDDGRVLKPGQVYRGANLSRATDNDLQQMAALRLGAVIDLRSPNEIEKEPDRLPQSSTPLYEVLPIYAMDPSLPDPEADWAVKVAALCDLSAKLSCRKMAANYEHFVSQYSHTFSAFVHRVTELCENPVFFHCAGGQDRTGFAAVILLLSLGVSRADAVAEYMSIASPNAAREYSSADLSRLDLHDEDVWIPGAQLGYVSASLRIIDELFGDFESYRRDPKGLNLSDRQVETLRKTWLT